MATTQDLFNSGLSLHRHLLQNHFRQGLLRGPDVGARWNLHLWRFLRSAADFIAWKDDYVFMQTQGYWLLANWILYDATKEARYRALALETTAATLREQFPEGYWVYPLPERKHLVATVEIIWGGIALLASYSREPRPEFLAGAVRVYDFLVGRIGFQNHARGRAINYFDRPRGKVPNNSVLAAWYFLRLWKATADSRFLEHLDGLLDFLAAVQAPSGEIPYIVDGSFEKGRPHYLCFQYNAFQFLQLAWSTKIQPLGSAQNMLVQLVRFLTTGVARSGACRTDCFHARPEVDYFTAVLAAALYEAERLRLVESDGTSERCFARLLSRQRADGSFAYSTGDYGLLRDTRSYPRQQVMTLFHLLLGGGLGDGFPAG